MDPAGAPVIGQTDYSLRLALVAVAGFVVAAFLVRLWLLQTTVASGNLVPIDPDHTNRDGAGASRARGGAARLVDRARGGTLGAEPPKTAEPGPKLTSAFM